MVNTILTIEKSEYVNYIIKIQLGPSARPARGGMGREDSDVGTVKDLTVPG